MPVAQKYDHNFRQLFIGHPRVRMDGLYIAICHYMYVFEIWHTTATSHIFSDVLG